jgi:hypothetical protein
MLDVCRRFDSPHKGLDPPGAREEDASEAACCIVNIAIEVREIRWDEFRDV